MRVDRRLRLVGTAVLGTDAGDDRRERAVNKVLQPGGGHRAVVDRAPKQQT